MHSRHFFRINYVTKAKVMMPEVSFEAMTENLSVGGVFIRTGYSLPVGKNATINITIPSAFHPAVTMKAEVVRSSNQGLAFQFKSLDYETFADLKAIIKQKPIPRW